MNLVNSTSRDLFDTNFDDPLSTHKNIMHRGISAIRSHYYAPSSSIKSSTFSTNLPEDSTSNSLEVLNLEYDESVIRKKPYLNFNTRFKRCWETCWDNCKPKKVYKERVITLGRQSSDKHPSNVVCNQKYNVFTFIPLVLWEQFSVFINFLFLLMACSQFVPQLAIGYWYTYWAPLGFVLFVIICREAVDDIRRWRRDREVNMAAYIRIGPSAQSTKTISASKIKLGDLIWIHKNQRIPADMILLYTTERNGACFIRTDQLDGETDWKLRHAVPQTQELVQKNGHKSDAIYEIVASIYAEKPCQSIHSFEGTFTQASTTSSQISAECPLSIEQTLWSNTVLASGSAIGVVIYTGTETRAVMNSNKPRNKYARLDIQVNNINKLLIACVVILSFIMVALRGFVGPWFLYYWRFFLLFSYIIPLALRVNMDFAKIVYALLVTRDKELEGLIVRNTTIPEDLGRIAYLMSDKTGTLTQNEMLFKKLHLGTVSYAHDSMEEVKDNLKNHWQSDSSHSGHQGALKKSGMDKLVDAVTAIALCHNVTPMSNDSTNTDAEQEAANALKDIKSDLDPGDPVGYQASSPDEIALVNWTATVGVTLVYRDQNCMSIRVPTKYHTLKTYTILQDFPFTSESKRMGIIVQDNDTKAITLIVKGADSVMNQLVKHTPWIDDEVGNLAREGLRTLVLASKSLTDEQWKEFSNRLHQAKMSTVDRSLKVEAVISSLLSDLDTICLTGVEDKLQEDVRLSLETLRNAGVRVWMLTGDKLETAECIAKSSRLVGRSQDIYTFHNVTNRSDAHFELNAFRRRPQAALVISGASLMVCLEFHEHEFVELTKQSPAVIVCRCTPTQKAHIVKMIKEHTRQIVAAIGDGGNDVGMIQAADIGLGLEGKEGKQASLASDYSMTQFKQVTRLLLVHGRNSYKNSCALSQFVMHRGIIISVMQAVFSSVYFFVAIQLFRGMLTVGYATIFTMFPVFSLVLDKDVPPEVAMRFPELYKDMSKGRDLSFKTFFVWALISVYQGFIIMYGALLLFEDDFIHIVAITFTALVITELLMVALTIRSWHFIMIIAEFFSISVYIISLAVFKNHFDPAFLQTGTFIWKTSAITAISCIPLVILKIVRMWLRPPVYARLQ